MSRKIGFNSVRSKPKLTRREKVDRQSIELLKDRIRLFGDQWREGCAIRVPAKTLREIREIGAILWLKIEEGTV